jgi:hypothetical protein
LVGNWSGLEEGIEGGYKVDPEIDGRKEKGIEEGCRDEQRKG